MGPYPAFKSDGITPMVDAEKLLALVDKRKEECPEQFKRHSLAEAARLWREGVGR